MKRALSILSLLLLFQLGNSQYYYRGELLDDKNKPVPNVNIYIHSTKVIVSAGSSGSFGIMSPQSRVDTFTFSVDGYEKLKAPVYTDKYNNIKLTLLSSVANLQKNKLSSFVKDFQLKKQITQISGSETYNEIIENDFIDASKFPTTGFAVNSDRASYSNIRRFINMKGSVPTNAVRIDEMINYFNLATDYPSDDSIFKVHSQFSQCPWNQNNFLLHLNIAAKKIPLVNIPRSNLVFLIDNSGSMEMQNRLAILKTSFKMLANNLREEDKITIITYGGNVEVLLDAISGKYTDSIVKVIDLMDASGDTPGESAINIAYLKAKHNFIKNGNNRIILATDGDFNVGIADEAELQKLVSLQSQSGIYLTCIGVGMGNYKDSKLEVLAKKGNGNFSYIDTEQEGEKIFVTELTQTLYSVADDVYMDVFFDKKYVHKYRLIGYDNKKNAISDTSSVLEGGQVGSGYSTMVLFEIEPTTFFDLNALENYLAFEIAKLKIVYKNTQNKKSEDYQHLCKFNFKPLLALPKHYGFATAVAMYGSYIKSSKNAKSITLDQIGNLTKQSADSNSFIQKEFLGLIEKSYPIYEPGKKRKGRKANDPQK